MSERVDEEWLERGNAGVLRRLGNDHERLAESVGALDELLLRLDDDSAASAFVLHVEFAHEFCELLHFPLEDALLEVVLEAGLTPSERRVVFVNLAQHQVIHAGALAVLGWATGHVPSEPDARADFCRSAESYVSALRGHLDFEERHLQPLLRRHLTTREAERIEAIAQHLMGALVGEPLERLTALDATSRVLAAG